MSKEAKPIVVNVLGVSYADGHLVIRTDAAKHGVRVKFHLARVPWTPGGPASPDEFKAEDITEDLLPEQFKKLWEAADAVVAVGSTAPLLPSVLLAARNAELSIADLNRVGEGEA